jgi:hypothetical protein
VHFRAQIGQKCTLFASESAKKGVFCRGEGRLFGRPKTGVFGGLARLARDTSRAREISLNASLIEFVTLMIAANNKIRTVFYICIMIIVRILRPAWGVLRTHL